MSDFAGTRVSTAGLGLLQGTAASAVTGSTASIVVGSITVTAQVVRGLTLAAGDVVLVGRQGSQWWVIARLYAAAPAAPTDSGTEPDPQPVTRTGSLLCTPVETRSRRDSKWRTDTDDVLQGSYGGYGTSTGCAFYGGKPRSLAGATVTAASVKVRRESGGVFAAQAPTLWLVTQSTRPSGAPTLTSATAGPSLRVNASTSAFGIPAAWAQAMVDGTSGALAVYDADGSPYLRYSGRGSWSPAWTLTIKWRR